MTTIRRRLIHTSARCYKNPYVFYDLSRQQPKRTFDPAHAFRPSPVEPELTAEERMAKVFGSVGTREAKRKEQELKSRVIAGVKVPARPEEPTNCCMSGCVNCVWEQYKDELEEWREQRTQAKKALLEKPHLKWPPDFGDEPDRSKKQDETMVEEDSWEDLPISIRVFVETEKKIRAKKLAKQRNVQQQQQQQQPLPSHLQPQPQPQHQQQ